jgi:hypothetical protein
MARALCSGGTAACWRVLPFVFFYFEKPLAGCELLPAAGVLQGSASDCRKVCTLAERRRRPDP